MQSYIVWNIAHLKKCHFRKLFEIEKLKLKNRRPTPDIAITQDCSSSGIKLLFLNCLNFRLSSFVRFILQFYIVIKLKMYKLRQKKYFLDFF